MRLLLRTLGWLLTPMLLLALALSVMVLHDRQPLVAERIDATPAERDWARRWLLLHQPGAHKPGQWVDLELSEHQLNLIANDLMDKLGQGQARIELGDGTARIQASLVLPWDLVPGYLNLECTLIAEDHRPKIRSARLGGLPLPGSLIESMAKGAVSSVDHDELLRNLVIEPDKLALSYAWRPDLLKRIGNGLIADADLPLMLRYQKDLDTWAAGHPRPRVVPLTDLLSHLLSKAAERSADGDPIQENRAVLMVLAAYVNGQRIRDPNESAAASKVARPRIVVLRGRHDLSQHFLASAALTIQGNDTLSSLVGWYKEMSDSQGGSGFSFADMAANRSGIRLAKLATESLEGARQVQRAAVKGLSENDFMPRIDGLPEGMNRGDFIADYGSDKAHLYREMIGHIDARIDERPLYHRPSS